MKFLSSGTSILIQGMTGREGLRMAEWMQQSGSKIVAGVTPGKAGQEVLGCPIFNSVQEAKLRFPDIEVASIVVPGLRVREAALESIAAGIPFIHILSEQVPVHDVLRIREAAQLAGVTVLGPSSVGYLQFPSFRVGYLGGMQPFTHLKQGGLALLSSSGGMANELLQRFIQRGIGLCCAVSVGGDRAPCTSLSDLVRQYDLAPEVKALAVFAEPGNPLLLSLIRGKIVPQKPLIVFLPGDGLEYLPKGLPYGHTGTMLSDGDLSPAQVRAGLKQRGIFCTGRVDEFYQECHRISQL